MAYKWKPNAGQRKAFAEKMKDPEEKEIYEERKKAKNTYSDDPRSFKHKSFVPTEYQNNEARRFLYKTFSELTNEQTSACEQIIYGFGCKEKIHHDYIHILHELIRKQNI